MTVVYFKDDFGTLARIKEFKTPEEANEFVTRKNKALDDQGLDEYGMYFAI